MRRLEPLKRLGPVAPLRIDRCDRGGNLGLQFQHVAQVPVIGLGPHVNARDGIDELRRDAL